MDFRDFFGCLYALLLLPVQLVSSILRCFNHVQCLLCLGIIAVVILAGFYIRAGYTEVLDVAHNLRID